MPAKRKRTEIETSKPTKPIKQSPPAQQPEPHNDSDENDSEQHEDEQQDNDEAAESNDEQHDEEADNQSDDEALDDEESNEPVDERFAHNFDDLVDENDPLDDDRSAAPLSSSKLDEFNAKLNATGMIYFSRLPPRMKPSHLRRILSDYGVIGRIFLNPAPLGRRNKAGQTKHKRFTDGWVEFEDKKIAKRVAITFNGTLMGGKSRSRWHDEIWNCMYLKGFKWHHLTEKLQHERREREARLRQELSLAKSETQEYRAQVEKAKVIEKVKEKRAKKSADGQSTDTSKVFRQFHQRPALDR